MRVIQCFMNVNMGNGQDGLMLIARRQVDFNDLEIGQHLVFINRRREALKIMSLCAIPEQGSRREKEWVVTYYRPKRRLDMNAIQYIPRAFQGGNFAFERAEELALVQALQSRPDTSSVRPGPLHTARAMSRAGITRA